MWRGVKWGQCTDSKNDNARIVKLFLFIDNFYFFIYFTIYYKVYSFSSIKLLRVNNPRVNDPLTLGHLRNVLYIDYWYCVARLDR